MSARVAAGNCVTQGTHIPPGYASFVPRELLVRLMAWKQQPSRIGSHPIRIVAVGGAAALMKKVMRQHNVASLPELIASAQVAGAGRVGCTMTMDLLGIAPRDLIDGVEPGGVATFIGDANGSNGACVI